MICRVFLYQKYKKIIFFLLYFISFYVNLTYKSIYKKTVRNTHRNNAFLSPSDSFYINTKMNNYALSSAYYISWYIFNYQNIYNISFMLLIPYR